MSMCHVPVPVPQIEGANGNAEDLTASVLFFARRDRRSCRMEEQRNKGRNIYITTMRHKNSYQMCQPLTYEAIFLLPLFRRRGIVYCNDVLSNSRCFAKCLRLTAMLSQSWHCQCFTSTHIAKDISTGTDHKAVHWRVWLLFCYVSVYVGFPKPIVTVQIKLIEST